MARMFRVLRLILLSSFCASPVLAQETLPVYLVQIFDTVAKYSPPPWINSPESLGDSETFRNQVETVNGTNAFVLEYIPKGESFEDWSELYAIFGETPLLGDVQGYRDAHIQGYANACSEVHWQGSNTTPPNTELFIVYCPSYIDRPEVGEISTVVMMMKGETLVKNYYHKRVPAFEYTPGGEQIMIYMNEIMDALVGLDRLEMIAAPN